MKDGRKKPVPPQPTFASDLPWEEAVRRAMQPGKPDKPAKAGKEKKIGTDHE